MGGPPPLATDAAVVERSDLHLHKRDGKLMAFPVIPVYTLPKSNTYMSIHKQLFIYDLISIRTVGIHTFSVVLAQIHCHM